MVELVLSRVQLPALTDPYAFHQVLWKAFPDTTERPFLFRADDVRDRRSPVPVLVQSTQAPTWSLVEGATAETKKLSISLRPGQLLRFLLRANPTKSAKGKDTPLDGDEYRRARGRRTPLRSHEDRVAWMVERFARAGANAAVGELLVSPRPPMFWERGSTEARLDGCDVSGALRVDDPALLEAALAKGIGDGKAFGFGLLSIRPA